MGAQGQTDGSLRWAFSTLSSAIPGNIIASPTVAADGTVYLGVQIGASTSLSPAGRLLAVRPDGAQRWSYATPDWIDSTPAIGGDGTLYFGCWDGKLYALRPDGSLRWAQPAGAFITSSPAVAADGTIYVGSGEGSLHAFNPDGSTRWSFPAAEWIESSPAIAPDGTIYFGSWDNSVYAVRPDGTEKWRFETGDDVVGSPAIAADGTVYVGSRDLVLYAIDPAGKLKWSAQLGDTIESAPAVGADGTVYLTTTGGRLFALTADGVERWRYPSAGQPALGAIYSSPALRADGSIVFGTSNNALYFLNADGTLRLRPDLGDWADSSPLVTQDGTIYIGCSDKRLYAFNSSSNVAMVDWPQFRRDPSRTGLQPIGAVPGTTGQLMNLSVRTYAGTGADTLTVGFVTTGNTGRTFLVRGVGPTLASYGVGDVLADPILTSFSGSAVTGVNDNWGTAANAGAVAATAAAVGAFPLPVGSLDATLLGELPPGGYTVQIGGARSANDVALMEVYDAGGTGDARLVNVSARSRVAPGAGVLIAGFVIQGSSRTILVRGIGPGLVNYGVEGTLADPRLQVFRDQQVVAENNDWATAGNATAVASGAAQVAAFPLAAGSRDAALLLTLPPGVYTAQVSGVNSATGVALVEIYAVP